jgi:hypothetical protein
MVMAYRGASSDHSRTVITLIEQEHFGPVIGCRLPLLSSLRECLLESIALGQATSTVEQRFENLRRFYAWIDKAGDAITHENALELFKNWTEELLHSVRIKKSITEPTAYFYAISVAGLLSKALNLSGNNPAGDLLRQTRIRKPKNLPAQYSDNQNLENTFAMGKTLYAIVDSLPSTVVLGSPPWLITLPDGSTEQIVLPSMQLNPKSNDPSNVNARRKVRARVEPGSKGIARRRNLVNLRIEAEFLIFIAETSINGTQAQGLIREDFRWSASDEKGYVKAYKGRRGGEVVFYASARYRRHFSRYLEFLVGVGFTEDDNRLFPFLASASRSDLTLNKQRDCRAVKSFLNRVGVAFVPAKQLRKSRLNFHLRQSDDPVLVAKMAANTPEVLLRHYEEPNHQIAVSQLSRYHSDVEQTTLAAGPGLCASKASIPKYGSNVSEHAPKPDCISPDGCLFCENHRDLDTHDYCWKLASHAYLKSIEASSYAESTLRAPHPANIVVDRINSKLDSIALTDDRRAGWVSDARDQVRSGEFHKRWKGIIDILEKFQ